MVKLLKLIRITMVCIASTGDKKISTNLIGKWIQKKLTWFYPSLDEASGAKKEANPMLLEISEKNINRVAGSWNNFDRYVRYLKYRIS